ncbi:hypothetical protein AAG570_003443 [Ranatra chinensis]|uniref:Uncharacterized protein n=1 Tax=Ranatra chinensis TaxID=642074 RepID=A0ABD0YG87_9HEMI
MAFKRRNMFYENKKKETTEISVNSRPQRRLVHTYKVCKVDGEARREMGTITKETRGRERAGRPRIMRPLSGGRLQDTLSLPNYRPLCTTGGRTTPPTAFYTTFIPPRERGFSTNSEDEKNKQNFPPQWGTACPDTNCQLPRAREADQRFYTDSSPREHLEIYFRPAPVESCPGIGTACGRSVRESISKKDLAAVEWQRLKKQRKLPSGKNAYSFFFFYYLPKQRNAGTFFSHGRKIHSS